MSNQQSIGCLSVGSVDFEVIAQDHYVYLIDHDEFQDIPKPEDIDWSNIPLVNFESNPPVFEHCDTETEEALKEFLGL